jgi:eukaryotic-like serine/threonine-protein kinase
MAGESARNSLTSTDRFELVRGIGEGGMGVVYEAVDRETRRKVALKTLRSLDAAAVLRFKNEFRSLQGLEHPNLVSLGELFEDDGQLFFTMELVQGTPFLEYVRPGSPPAVGGSVPPPPKGKAGPRYDEARLRDAFAQLSRGLRALHRARKVHRDIKPSNVLVTPSGRVVILDFGLVMSVAPRARDTAIVGTAQFMAPEQAAGGPVGPEADWYSVGVMLYLALTGALPFRVSSDDRVLELKQESVPPPPGSRVEGLPSDLEQLCVGLLKRSPAARPKWRDVLRLLGSVEPQEGSPFSMRAPSFVGRRRELAALHAAFTGALAGAPVVALIEGESGMGKSALMGRFLEQVEPDSVVLAGRCYERESVPYKAVDELVDALSRYLSGCWASDLEELLPPNAALLGDVFPVLRMIPALDRPHDSAAISISPAELRARVFASLRELLSRIAREKPLVLAIDDLQWADADSLALLAEVIRPTRASPAPAILLVATVRTVAEERPRALPWSASLPGEVRSIKLHRLPADEAQELVVALLREAGELGRGGASRAADDPAPVSGVAINAEALVEEAGGHPLFIDALLRYRLVEANDGGPVRLDDALWARIQRLEPRAQALVELVAVAGGPLLVELAERALPAENDELNRLIGVLRAGSLARKSGAGREERVELCHDRIREVVVGRLPPGVLRAFHERLARALEAQGALELEALAVHYREAGDAARAAEYAARAGDKAALALAFDRAARLYLSALELGPREPRAREDLLTKRGDALSNAGRSAEAARAYLRGSLSAPPAVALELTRRAAESYLRSGYIDEGMDCLRRVLSAVGVYMPRSLTGALVALALRRAELRLRGLDFKERPAHLVPPGSLTRIDVCWSAAVGLAMVDPIVAASYQAQNLLLSLEAGEPYRVARSLAFEAALAATRGGEERARSGELTAAALAIAERTGDPHALGLVELSAGVARYSSGRFRESLAGLDRAESIFRDRCTGVFWERSSIVTFAVWDLWLLGDLRELSRRVPLHLREAEERGDRYLATNLRTHLCNAHWLIQGDPKAALGEVDAATSAWSRESFYMQHFFDFVARGQVALYQGDFEACGRLVDAVWARLRRSLILRMQSARILSEDLRGRAALAAARAHPRRRGLLQQATRAAEQIEAERMSWASPIAALLRAGVAAIDGDAARAAAITARAADGFRTAEMALFHAVARRCQGKLIGGADGCALVEEASAWMRGQGVVEPDRMAAMLAPGI